MPVHPCDLAKNVKNLFQKIVADVNLLLETRGNNLTEATVVEGWSFCFFKAFLKIKQTLNRTF